MQHIQEIDYRFVYAGIQKPRPSSYFIKRNRELGIEINFVCGFISISREGTHKIDRGQAEINQAAAVPRI